MNRRILVTVQGRPEDTAKAVEVIDKALTAAGYPATQSPRHLHAALTAAGYPPHRPPRHLHAVPEPSRSASC